MVVSMQVAPADFDRLFGALADPTRRDIVRRAISGDEGVAELALHYPMSFAAVPRCCISRAIWAAYSRPSCTSSCSETAGAHPALIAIVPVRAITPIPPVKKERISFLRFRKLSVGWPATAKSKYRTISRRC